MTAVRHGPQGGVIHPGPDDQEERGIKEILTAPTFAAVDHTKTYAAELAVKALKPRGDRTIGLVGTVSMPYPFLAFLKNGRLPGAEFVDATDMVDEIKAIKSEEEIECIRKAAAMQDAVMEEVSRAIKPGKKDFEIMAVAQHAGQDRGSEQGLFLVGSAPMGTPSRYLVRHIQGREIKKGDQFTILVENNGPGGFYTEIGRTFVLGKASQEMLDELEFTLEAQRFTLDLLKPGAEPAEILTAYNNFMKSNGRPEEKRLYAHGQGYDLVERPVIREDEKMKIAANMNIVVHPGYATKTVFSWICDNYLITETGVSECLHRTPKKIFEL
jgi:Xaa-Pro aminopeptidase